MGQAFNDALAYKSYMVIWNKAPALSKFTWESGGSGGNYLRDQSGWFLGYDGPSGCLCARSKGLSSFWEVKQRNEKWYLIDKNGKYAQWLPNQKWPLASTTTFISEGDWSDNALIVALDKTEPPK
ncbi:MAG: hypothetical protein ACREDA_01150 [Methylocella sp.]